MGACGIFSQDSEFVCAIPDALYETKTIGGNPNNNAFCNKQILVTGPLGTTVVSIVDRCGSCKNVSEYKLTENIAFFSSNRVILI